MRKCLSFGTLLCLFLFAAAPAFALQSTFDADADGWTAVNDYKNFTWADTGGNPDGFIHATDVGDGRTWYFVAPASWLGDWSGFLGQTLSYDIKLITKSGGYFNNNDVVIKSDAAQAVWQSPVDPPLGSWQSYAVVLDAAHFTASGGKTFEQILDNVTALWIRGEYISGGDKEGLDNVRVIPLPASLWLLGSGLAGLMALRRRARR